MFNLVAHAAAAENAAQQSGASAGGFGGIGMTVVYIAIMIAVFYFLLIRPQKKQEKAKRRMLDDMRVGDKVITIGGIMGRIVNVKDESVVIESGSDRTKLRFEKSAIKEVLTEHEDE